MRISRVTIPILATALAFTAVPLAQNDAARSGKPAAGAATEDPRLERLKTDAVKDVDSMKGFTQQMVDSIFSFAELGFQESETNRYLIDILKKNGFSVQEGIAGIPTAFMATWGSGKPVIALGSDIDGIPQASQKPGVAYHVADDRGRARPRRRPQLGTGRERHGGARGEEDHGAREAPGNDPHLARHRRGAGGHEGVLRARRLLQGRRRRAVHARRQRADRVVGRPHRDGARLGRIHLQGSDRAFGGRAVARPQRARRRRADEHRLELPARAPAARAPLALRHHQRRRSAERRPAHRVGLVLLPAHDVSQDQGAVGDRRRHREGRRDDDEHRARRLAGARERVAAAHEQDRGRDDLVEHSEGRHARVERRGSDARQGAAEGARQPRTGSAAEGRRAAAGARDRESRRRVGRHRRHLLERARRSASGSRPTFPDCPATTGRTQFPWRRPSRTRARPPARRSRR